jgi:cell division protein FtsW (lipid II flippase)/cell division protein FtsI/penicillin-binding protein 2
MRVITPAIPAIDPAVRRVRAMRFELFGLCAASLVLVFGSFLAVTARTKINTAEPPSIYLPAVTSASELKPLLTMFPSAPERELVAQAIYRRVSSEPRLQHAGGLAGVTVPADTIRSTPGLTRLRERLDRRPDAQAIPVFTGTDIAALKPRLAVRTEREFNLRAGRALGLVLVAFWIAHLVRRWRRRDDDPVLLPAMMLLCAVGLMTMFGLRDPLRDTVSASTFAWGVAAGIVALLVASEIDFESSRLRRAVILPLGAALALAMLLLVFGSGPGSSGVKVNLFGAQPVEAIRLLVVFALAAYFGRRLELLRALSEPESPSRPWLRFFRVPRWKDVRPVLVSMALVLLFFFFQKDLGPALVLTCVFLALYGIGRGHVAFVLTGFALLVLGFATAYWIGEPATVRHRVAIWANPWNNGVPGGNQIAHGFWALATGGIWGSGPGLGSADTIPTGHTDFVLAAVGEELGFLGLAAVFVLYGVLAWRCIRIGLRAPGDYTAFLAIGVALALVVQAMVIASGLLGLVPLSGVVTPFLSYGRSSMLANSAALGIVLAIAQRRGRERLHLRQPVRVLSSALAVAAAVIAGRAAWIQVVHADDFAVAASLSEQADGGYRFEYNPRLLAAARTLPRGTIYDRNGLPLATSRPSEIAAVAATYKAAGIEPVQSCAEGERCYPLGGLTFHLLGDWNHQTNWGAPNSSYIERDKDAELKGYGDRPRTIEVTNPRTGRRHAVIRRDYRELLPLVRQRYWPYSPAVNGLRGRDRDLHTSIDARLQFRAAAALRKRIEAGGETRGAAVVLDPASGEVLASVSYPWPDTTDLRSAAAASHGAPQWLDRARYGLYPPGSVFKLLVAGAALRSHADNRTFMCVRLPGGRVGHPIHGSNRPVRDDPKDTVPHGSVDLHKGLVVSCNAFFAQLAQELGPQPLLDAASVFQIDVAPSSTPSALRPTLPHAGYGQGHVVVSPVKVARVTASLAAGGVVTPLRWFVDPPETAVAVKGTPIATTGGDTRFVSQAQAARLTRAMRGVVTDGSGRAVKSNPVPIAGKTGTAEVTGKPAHSWFTGFAPYGEPGPRIAFAVLVENAGYGARAAAPVASEIVTAAKELGLIK